MTTLSTQPPKGFRDMYPNNMRVQNWLYSIMRMSATLFGYEEYDAPMAESLDLYTAKSSQDLVEYQTFQIRDRADRKLTLRPEMTPSLARMVAARQQELGSPLRWFNIGPRFRYEAPQRGRSRQFTQWDVDLIGPTTPEADAEIIAVLATFFQKLDLTSQDIVIKVNNRRLMEFKASLLDIQKKDMPQLFQMIDKRDKMAENKWVAYLKKQGLTGKQVTNLQSILADREVAFESEELTQTFSTLKDLGLAGYVEFDPSIVRGLDYYTGTVFEVRDRADAFRAIAGGGRYDNLIELFGGAPVSGIGFAAGDMVLLEILKDLGKLPNTKDLGKKPPVLVTVFGQAQIRDSLGIVRLLRQNNVAAELYPDAEVKLDKQLKYADKKGIRYALILGPDEIQKGALTIKDLLKKDQTTLPQKQALTRLTDN